MKKRLFCLLMLFVTIFSLASCYDLADLLGSSGKSEEGHSLEYTYDEDEKIEIEAKMAEVEANLEGLADYEEFYSLFSSVDSFVMDIATYTNIEYLNYCMTGNTGNQDKYLEFSAYLNELIEWEESILRRVYNSSYKDQFFRGMSEEEIEEYLGPEYTSEFYTLENEVEEIISEYNNLSEEDMIQQTPELYMEIVDKYNQMADIAGYDNYLEYAYENVYSRDFMPEDVEEFNENVKDYIVPLFFDIYDKFQITASALSSRNSTKVTTFVNGNYSENMSLFEQYAKEIGGSYYTNYKGLWDNGYYYFSNNSNAINGAFTTYLYNLDTPVVYFGPDYQNITTLVHEYGHYYAMKCQNGGTNSMDLSETHSQSNEFLFLAYVEQESDYISTVTDAIKEYMLMNSLSTIIYSTIVNEFEMEVYSNPNITAEELDQLIIDFYNEYGGYDKFKGLFDMDPKDYWKYVAIENAGYYISYAVSLIPSISMYQLATDDLDSAIDSYLDICNYSYLEDDFLDVITDAGLYTPFDESSFTKIVEIFE